MPSFRWPRPSTDPDVGAPAFPAGERVRARVAAIPRPRPELVGLLVLAAVLYLWALDQNGWANEYYSAAVRSMSSSWHNFLFASLDPSGVMTVDKPPLAVWVQALSVRAFGFHPLSVLVPEALMGIASVALGVQFMGAQFNDRLIVRPTTMRAPAPCFLRRRPSNCAPRKTR